MDNKKFLEKAFLCLGVLFLFVGLWNFIDFSLINEYVILIAIAICSVISYVVAHKNKFNSQRISTAFAAISLGLTITSIIMSAKVFRVHSLTWLLVVFVGIYLLLFLSEFNNKFFYFVFLIYPLYSIRFLLETNVILSLLGTCFIVLFCIKLSNDYANEYTEDIVLSVILALMTIYIPTVFLDFFSYNLMQKYLLSGNTLSFIIILDAVVLLYITKFSNLNLLSGFRKTYNFVLSAFSLFFANNYFWKNILPDGVAILIALIFAGLIIYWLIIKILNGSKPCFLLFIMQSVNITFSNLYGVVSTSVFLMILGGVLISVAILLNKNKVGEKRRKYE